MSSLRAGIAGIGFWANGLPGWNDAVAFARAGTLPENAPAKPSPQLLAPNERRRGPAGCATRARGSGPIPRPPAVWGRPCRPV